MQYLNAAEYVPFGLSEETRDDLVVAASAMIDAFCRRPSLAITEYTERLRFGRRGTVQLSNAPLAALDGAASAFVSVRVRLGRAADARHPLATVADTFALARTWSVVDPATLDVSSTGEVGFAPHLLGLSLAEAEMTYTAGYATIPTPVKIACAQIVRNAESMPALTVKRQAIDSMQMEYFSGALIDAEVQRLLRPYVSERMG
jgi:hypothetical protein